MAIVYQHIAKKDNRVFYIGISMNENRAYNKVNRSDLWKKFVSDNDYYIKILYNDIDLESAKLIEKELISYYGKFPEGELLNQTDGGEFIKRNKRAIRNKPKNKVIKFDTKDGLSRKEKQSIAAKEMGKIKTDKTFVKIQQFMIDNDYKPTQKEVANSLGLGIATIKRHWKNIIRK